jgi:carbon storage regulator CsrA
MLVLSRRPDEKIFLPTVPAVIKVIATHSGLVRLGIEAPPDVPILREELYKGEEASPARRLAGEEASPEALPRSVRHALRNRANALTLGLALLRMQLPASAEHDLLDTLEILDAEVQAICQFTSPVHPQTGGPGPDDVVTDVQRTGP